MLPTDVVMFPIDAFISPMEGCMPSIDVLMFPVAPLVFGGSASVASVDLGLSDFFFAAFGGNFRFRLFLSNSIEPSESDTLCQSSSTAVSASSISSSVSTVALRYEFEPVP